MRDSRWALVRAVVPRAVRREVTPFVARSRRSKRTLSRHCENRASQFTQQRRFDIVTHAKRLGVQLSPLEIACLRSDVARRVAHDGNRFFTRADFVNMVSQANGRHDEREALVEYISKTDQNTAGQKLLLALDFLGTSLFALIGTQVAGQAGMNVVGAVLVGCVASVGGGTLNNMMTGNTRGGVFWMRDPRFLVIAIWSSLATFYLWPEYEEWQSYRHFQELVSAAGRNNDICAMDKGLRPEEFERAFEASPQLAERITHAVRPQLDAETIAAIDAAPKLASRLVFEWLTSSRLPPRSSDTSDDPPTLTPAELRMVARLLVMDSPLLFGLETAALGAVAVIGAQAGITRGVGPLGSIATGVTICFGGVLRDVLCQREVAIGAQSYALATCAGASVYVGLRQLVCMSLLPMPLLLRIFAGAGTAIGQRLFVYVSDASDHLLEPMRISKPILRLGRSEPPPLSGCESLCAAAAHNDVYELKILIHNMQVNPHVVDYDKRTALHLAAAEGAFDAVRFLVEDCHVQLSPLDRWHVTPLDEALSNSHYRVAAYLRTRGARTGASVNNTSQPMEDSSNSRSMRISHASVSRRPPL